MTPEELREGAEFVLREFYTGRRVLRRLAYAVRQFGAEVALSLAIPFNVAYWCAAREYAKRSATARHAVPRGIHPSDPRVLLPEGAEVA